MHSPLLAVQQGILFCPADFGFASGMEVDVTYSPSVLVWMAGPLEIQPCTLRRAGLCSHCSFNLGPGMTDMGTELKSHPQPGAVTTAHCRLVSSSL